jgi:hypothetical protein
MSVNPVNPAPFVCNPFAVRVVTALRHNAASSVTVARQEIVRQQGIDKNWSDPQGALLARMSAVVGAQRAVAAAEAGARHALRQSLVDLAAISELIADGLPQPVPPSKHR